MPNALTTFDLIISAKIFIFMEIMSEDKCIKEQMNPEKEGKICANFVLHEYFEIWVFQIVLLLILVYLKMEMKVKHFYLWNTDLIPGFSKSVLRFDPHPTPHPTPPTPKTQKGACR